LAPVAQFRLIDLFLAITV